MLRTLEISKKLRSRFLAVALSWRGYRGRTSAVALTGYPDRKLTLERVDAGKPVCSVGGCTSEASPPPNAPQHHEHFLVVQRHELSVA